MKFVTISDVHIKNAVDCPHHQLFLQFLKCKDTQNSDAIYLLGDIFDIMVGDHFEYIDEYSEIFENLIKLSRSGKEIFYFEGNHDFHIVQLLNKFAKKNNLNNFRAMKLSTIKIDSINNKKIYLGHGDEIEIDNLSYRIYTFFIRSYFMKLVANWIFNYKFIKWLGAKASSHSRQRNDKKYSEIFDTENIRNKFRDSARLINKNANYDFIICGHSHVKDEYEDINKFKYLNNGYFPIEMTYVKYDNGKCTLENLS